MRRERLSGACQRRFVPRSAQADGRERQRAQQPASAARRPSERVAATGAGLASAAARSCAALPGPRARRRAAPDGRRPRAAAAPAAGACAPRDRRQSAARLPLQRHQRLAGHPHRCLVARARVADVAVARRSASAGSSGEAAPRRCSAPGSTPAASSPWIAQAVDWALDARPGWDGKPPSRFCWRRMNVDRPLPVADPRRPSASSAAPVSSTSLPPRRWRS